MPENIVPTITDRDFVIATVVSPTILVEPEKTETTTEEGEIPADGATEGAAEGVAPAEEGEDKSAKPADDKAKAPAGDKGKPASKETKKK